MTKDKNQSRMLSGHEIQTSVNKDMKVRVGGREERMGVSADEEVYVASDQGLQASCSSGNLEAGKENMEL